MTDRERRPADVEFLEARRVRLVESVAPYVSPEQRRARDREWDAAVAANPALFDGPVAACAGAAWDGPGSLVLSWARVTYRHYALRRVPGARALPSLFVNVVQPADDGRVMVVRMSASTAAAGRWQLPGGSVEPPEAGEALDASDLRRNAARELGEETGLDAGPEELRMWVVTRGENGGVGVVHLASPRPESELRERFEAVVAAEREQGREAELDRIAFVRSAAEAAELPGTHADYLGPLVRRAAVRIVHRGPGRGM
ncbi:NUDIX domain-containing protein [Streptomyces sp. NPDC026673]|uniref:NUDIX hydrolase n=1 Tax=Streptomyces sp. NPDC026673 TaxID=3155724 RepID=UPI0033FAB740